MDPDFSEKTILDVALELGVRSETVLEAVQAIGLEAEGLDMSIDSELESMVVNHLVSEGSLPEKVAKGRGRRKRSDEPLADDDLITEALGASKDGFSQSQIPRQIVLESSFDESKSWFSRLFGKKKNLANSLKEHAYSADEIDSLFAQTVSSSPSSERFGESREVDDALSRESMPYSEDVEDFVEADLNTDLYDVDDDPDALDDTEVDPELMSDLDGLDIDDESISEEELEDVSLEDLSEDIGLDPEDVENLSLGEEDEDLEIGEEEMEGLDDLDDLDDESVEGEEGEHGLEDEDEEAPRPPGYIEKLLSRIQLSPQESWALMIGSASIMLLLLGIAAYWYTFNSPSARVGLYDEAVAAFEDAETDRELDNYYQSAEYYRDSAGLFREYINQFPDSPLTEQAFEQMCDAWWQVATYSEEEGEETAMEEGYREAAELYESYLNFLDRRAQQAVFDPNAESFQQFPDETKRMNALRRIAIANRKLQQFQVAAEFLSEFVEKHGRADDDFSEYELLAETYIDWSKTNSEEEIALLGNAVDVYQQAIDILQSRPDVNHEQLMRIYAGMGDIEKQRYDRSLEMGQNLESGERLREAIAFYERAEEQARMVDVLRPSDKIRVLKSLADNYLIQGRENGKIWGQQEFEAEHHPVGQARDIILQRVENAKEETERFLNDANQLYDELLQEPLSQAVLEDILSSKAESLYILRDYRGAIAAGEQLLTNEDDLSKPTKDEILYLMGHAAWSLAQAGETDFTMMKDYYRRALEQEPLYPKKETAEFKPGEMSHLAEIRLTNTYYLVDGDYEQAIQRFNRAVDNYPNTGYTFLTLYWFGNALEKYGDTLMEEALAEEEIHGGPTESSIQKRNRARKLYEDAVSEYSRGIEVRDESTHVDKYNRRFLIEILFDRGNSAFKAGNYRQAEDFLLNAKNEFSGNRVAQQYLPQAIERLGDINNALGDYERASMHYRDYIDKTFVDPEARVRLKLADVYRNQLSGDLARRRYNEIVRSYGTQDRNGPGFYALKSIAESHLQEAGTLSGQQRVDKLQEALGGYANLAARFPHSADETLPDDTDSLRSIGNIHFQLDNFEQAIPAYKTYLNSKPDSERGGMIQYRIGKSHLAIGQPQEAIDELLTITSDQMDTASQYADALLLLGQAYEAQANIFLQNGQDALWEQNMNNAMREYTQVFETGIDSKIQEARRSRQALDTLLKSRQGLSMN